MPPDAPAKKKVRTESGDRLRCVEAARRAGKIDSFNHAGPTRQVILGLAKMGGAVTAEQFRDGALPSPELADNRNAGRHEIPATAERGTLAGNPVAVAVAAAARTSTALSALSGPNNEVIVHSNMFASGKSTSGQSDAHKPFHAWPQSLALITDPYVATARTVETALGGLSRSRHIRSDPSITGSTPIIGRGPLEAPNTSRGNDDGYESNTERGRFARRFAQGEIHLKDSLVALRNVSEAARKRTRSPSPNPRRGGTGSAPRGTLALPDVSGLTPEGTASELTNFAFLGFQTLKK